MHSQRPAELNDPDRRPPHPELDAGVDLTEKVRRWLKEDPQQEPTRSVLYLFGGGEPTAESPTDFLHNYVDGLMDLDLHRLQEARSREHAREIMHELVEELRQYDYPDWPWIGARAQRAIMRHWWTAARVMLGAALLYWYVVRPLAGTP